MVIKVKPLSPYRNTESQNHRKVEVGRGFLEVIWYNTADLVVSLCVWYIVACLKFFM